MERLLGVDWRLLGVVGSIERYICTIDIYCIWYLSGNILTTDLINSRLAAYSSDKIYIYVTRDMNSSIYMYTIRMPSPDPQTLTTFFNHASSILGDEHISRTPDHGALPSHKNQDAYNDPFSTTSTRVSGALRPNSVAEIQEILRLANTYKIPLWPISRGRNLGYGSRSQLNQSV